MKRKSTNITASMLLALALGCGDDSLDSYVGVWKALGANYECVGPYGTVRFGQTVMSHTIQYTFTETKGSLLIEDPESGSCAIRAEGFPVYPGRAMSSNWRTLDCSPSPCTVVLQYRSTYGTTYPFQTTTLKCPGDFTASPTFGFSFQVHNTRTQERSEVKDHLGGTCSKIAWYERQE